MHMQISFIPVMLILKQFAFHLSGTFFLIFVPVLYTSVYNTTKNHRRKSRWHIQITVKEYYHSLAEASAADSGACAFSIDETVPFATVTVTISPDASPEI